MKSDSAGVESEPFRKHRDVVRSWVLFALLLALPIVWNSSCNRSGRDLETIFRDYPRVDGSTSTHPLSVLVACKINRVPYRWETPPALERTVFPAGEDSSISSWIEKNIQHHGTHEAYMNLISGKAELILVARAPSIRETESASQHGVSFDVRPIALDALVFVVHKSNRVSNLTLSQIRSIYGPKGIKNWAEVGGSNVALEAFQREQDSGSQEIMEGLVMKGIPIRGPDEIRVIYTMAGVVHAVAKRENAIAYSIFYYVTNMAPDPLTKMIAVEGIRPAPETIGAWKYPLTTEAFAVIRKDAKGESRAVLLRNWLLSAKGQSAVRESGYVPITEKSESSL